MEAFGVVLIVLLWQVAHQFHAELTDFVQLLPIHNFIIVSVQIAITFVVRLPISGRALWPDNSIVHINLMRCSDQHRQDTLESQNEIRRIDPHGQDNWNLKSTK